MKNFAYRYSPLEWPWPWICKRDFQQISVQIYGSWRYCWSLSDDNVSKYIFSPKFIYLLLTINQWKLSYFISHLSLKLPREAQRETQSLSVFINKIVCFLTFLKYGIYLLVYVHFCTCNLWIFTYWWIFTDTLILTSSEW